MLKLTKPHASWMQDQYNVSFAGMVIGCVGMINNRWFCVAEDSSVEIELHFATAEEAAQYMLEIVTGARPQRRLRLISG